MMVTTNPNDAARPGIVALGFVLEPLGAGLIGAAVGRMLGTNFGVGFAIGATSSLVVGIAGLALTGATLAMTKPGPDQ